MLLMEIATALCAYLLGSVCAAYYYGKFFHKTDVRDHGSGNLGATNAGRVLGKKAYSYVLIWDVAKGMTTVAVGKWLGFSDVFLWLSIYAVVIGHMFPIQLKLRGGIGVASYLGALFIYHSMYLFIILGLFTLIYAITRKWTFSGYVAFFLLPVVMLIFSSALYSYDPLAIGLLTTMIWMKLYRKEILLMWRKVVTHS